MSDYRYGAIRNDNDNDVGTGSRSGSGPPSRSGSGMGSASGSAVDVRLRVETSISPLKPWEFPGWGSTTKIRPDPRDLRHLTTHLAVTPTKLSEWLATAICGNDILSSCLYVSGIVAAKAGKLAPLALAIVAGVLYLYRFIYGEVVNAIPLNGGSYNVLLNTTTKRVASVAASLAILSYLATGVVSGTSACNYLASQLPALPVVPATIGLLLFFAVLSLIGITESAVVALIIFVLHALTLTTLCVFSATYVVRDNFEILRANFATGFPDINLAGEIVSGNLFTAIFFGTSTAMLGISGFESSSQFVQEQADGVFPKTLRNMWWGVAIFNPLISLLSLGVMPLHGPTGITEFKNTVLARMGFVVGGPTLQTIVALDAFIVLSGAVLTAYVGFNGLVRRLSSDRVLPALLLETNSLRHTNHYIIIGYFVVSVSLVLILHGDAETLSGVYTYAFLGLMTLFGSGCMLLKFKRADIPRSIVAPWPVCVVGVSMVLATLLGNLLGDPTVLTYFALYWISVLSLVMLMFERTFLLRICLYCMQHLCPSRRHKLGGVDEEETNSLRTGARGGKTIARVIREINEPAIFFFCKRPNLSIINKAILYVRTNEQTRTMFIVHCVPEGTKEPEGFEETVALFDHIYLKIQINYLSVEGTFGPAMVEWLSRTYDQPKNLMFIKQPSHDFVHTVASLGGVRVITG